MGPSAEGEAISPLHGLRVWRALHRTRIKRIIMHEPIRKAKRNYWQERMVTLSENNSLFRKTAAARMPILGNDELASALLCRK